MDNFLILLVLWNLVIVRCLLFLVEHMFNSVIPYYLRSGIMQIIPRQLCDNAGFDATDVLNKLRQKHALPSGMPTISLWRIYNNNSNLFFFKTSITF